jgi:hypothetical protein
MVLQALMRSRRPRELLIIVGFLVLVAASFAVPAVQKLGGGLDQAGLDSLGPALAPFLGAIEALPPGLAASGLVALQGDATRAVVSSAIWLVVWVVAGCAVGLQVLSRFHLDEASSAGIRPAPREKKEGVAGPGLRRLSWLVAAPRVVRAVAAKELAVLLRSTLGRFNLAVSPLLPAIAALVFAEDVGSPLSGLDPERMVFYGLLVYGTLLSNTFLCNAFMWEGGGLQAYYLWPAPLRQVLLGKHVAVWLLNAVILAVCVVTWTLCAGWLGITPVLTGALIFAVCVLLLTIVGIPLSILAPARRSASAMVCPPSQVAMAISFATIIASAVVVGVPLTLTTLAGRPGLLPIILIGLLAIEAWVYRLVLRQASRLMVSRREALIELVAGEAG